MANDNVSAERISAYKQALGKLEAAVQLEVMAESFAKTEAGKAKSIAEASKARGSYIKARLEVKGKSDADVEAAQEAGVAADGFVREFRKKHEGIVAQLKNHDRNELVPEQPAVLQPAPLQKTGLVTKTSNVSGNEKYTVTREDNDGLVAIARRNYKPLIDTAASAIAGGRKDTLTPELAVALSIAKRSKKGFTDAINVGDQLTIPTKSQLVEDIAVLRRGVLTDNVIAYSKEVKGRSTDAIFAQVTPSVPRGERVAGLK